MQEPFSGLRNRPNNNNNKLIQEQKNAIIQSDSKQQYVMLKNKQTFTCTESLSLSKSKMLGSSEKHYFGYQEGS